VLVRVESRNGRLLKMSLMDDLEMFMISKNPENEAKMEKLRQLTRELSAIVHEINETGLATATANVSLEIDD
jgi:hypothetical protein